MRATKQKTIYDISNDRATKYFSFTVLCSQQKPFLEVSAAVGIEYKVSKQPLTPYLITFKFKGELLDLACVIKPYYDAGLPFSVSNFDFDVQFAPAGTFM